MKKGLNIALLVISGAVIVIGAGTLGGTFPQFKNYQTISTQYNDVQKMLNSIPADVLSSDPTLQQLVQQYQNTSLSDSVNAWNSNIASLTAAEKTTLNNALKASKETFYQQWPNFEAYKEWFNQIAGSSGSTMDENVLRLLYSSQTSTFEMNYNYSADQAGLIAGAVLLVLGLVAFITFLAIFLKNKKRGY